MSTILKEDVLRGKNRESCAKDKVDKIMDTIIESAGIVSCAKTENTETKVPSESMKSPENAGKQYIFSDEILLDGERQSDLDGIRNRLAGELKPSDEIELLIVDHIVSSVWRLKRCLKIESLVMEYDRSCIQEYDQGFFRTRKRTDKELSQLKALKIIENKNRIVELSKYETMLEMQLYKALKELSRYRRQELREEKKASRRTK